MAWSPRSAKIPSPDDRDFLAGIVLIACDLLDGRPMPLERAGDVIRIVAISGGTFAQRSPFDPATDPVTTTEHRE
jgi:hypothetical protein